MDGHPRGLLGGTLARAPGVTAEAYGSRAGVEAWRHGVGGSDERRGLLKGGARLQKASLLLEGWWLSV